MYSTATRGGGAAAALRAVDRAVSLRLTKPREARLGRPGLASYRQGGHKSGGIACQHAQTSSLIYDLINLGSEKTSSL